MDLLVLVDSEPWYTCPHAGCTARGSAAIGEKWVIDVLAVHAELHHKPWRW